jgi:hypothetical protein
MIIALKSIVSCDMLGLEESFKALVLGIHFPRLVNMLQTEEKKLPKPTICVNQIYSKKFVEMHNLAQKIWKG